MNSSLQALYVFIVKDSACWLGSLMHWRQTSVTQTMMSGLSELNLVCPLLLCTTDVESFSLLPPAHFQKGMSRASYLLSALNIAS